MSDEIPAGQNPRHHRDRLHYAPRKNLVAKAMTAIIPQRRALPRTGLTPRRFLLLFTLAAEVQNIGGVSRQNEQGDDRDEEAGAKVTQRGFE